MFPNQESVQIVVYFLINKEYRLGSNSINDFMSFRICFWPKRIYQQNCGKLCEYVDKGHIVLQMSLSFILLFFVYFEQ